MFKKILIANRGEIACRIARTCRRLGVEVAGVHSVADRDALHVKEIGESIEIGGAPASESYLRIDAVIAAAKATGAQAIHPGFGFLAENAAFARAVEAAGLVFIGPTGEVIDRLGDKAAAKQEAQAAGVAHGAGQPHTQRRPRRNRRAGAPDWPARRCSRPRPAAAARAMRAIAQLAGLEDEIDAAMREAKSSFGSAGLIVEKLVERGRHIEVQIVGDGKGHVIHLFERECTLQRRHQKLIEEAPAAQLDPELRARMTADAVRLGQRLKYRGVGTVEFIVGGEDYYFLEVNPRLQVEHPVTEAVTGLDIVELMLRIAAGEGLPLHQEDVHLRGHAVEARICAEDPAAGFLPSTGRLVQVRFPREGVRVETGIEAGMEVTPYYDPMLAKLITHADTRDAALDRLRQALDDTAIFGVTTNCDFLKRLIDLPETRSARFHTRLIDEQIASWDLRAAQQTRQTLALAAYYWLYAQRRNATRPLWQGWGCSGWSLGTGDESLSAAPSLHMAYPGGSVAIRFAPLQADGSMCIGVGDDQLRVALQPVGGDEFLAIVQARRERVRLHQDGDTLYLHDRQGVHAFQAVPYLSYISAAAQASGELKAPMMGLILKVNAAVGEHVEKGAVVALLESMKMEMRICAECAGTVTAIHCQAGQTVERNAIVAVIEPDEEA